MGQLKSKQIHIIENLINNSKIFKEETQNKVAKGPMKGKEVGIPEKDAQKLVKGKLEKAFSQVLANSTAYSSQFENSNYEGSIDDRDLTINITARHRIYNGAANHNSARRRSIEGEI